MVEGSRLLIDRSKWPQETEKFDEAQEIAEELKQNSELVLMALEKKNYELDTLLQKSTLKKTRRVTAWCLRFCKNALLKKQRKSLKLGLLKTEELTEADSHWIRREPDWLFYQNVCPQRESTS